MQLRLHGVFKFSTLAHLRTNFVSVFCEQQNMILIAIIILPHGNELMIRRESDEVDEDGTDNGSTKRQVKLSSLGFTGFKRKTEEIESSGKGRCKFFQARKLELVRKFQ